MVLLIINSFKNNLAELFFVEHTVGYFEDVIGRNSLHLANNVVHVFDGLAHDE